jgi:hypothetical protein
MFKFKGNLTEDEIMREVDNRTAFADSQFVLNRISPGEYALLLAMIETWQEREFEHMKKKVA